MQFPFDTDFIAIPAILVSLTTLIVVSLLTPRTEDEVVNEFFD